MTKERIEDVVVRLANPVAESLGYELVDVEYKKEGADWVLRCYIDCPDGVGLDECQRFSESIGKVLDAEDPIPGRYLLEVSSPGLERPLKKESDYQRFLGEMVEIKLHKAMNGQKKFKGKLHSYDITRKIIGLEFDQKIVEIPFQDVAKANLSANIFGIEGGNKGK